MARSIVMLFAYAAAITAETTVFLSVIYFAESDLLAELCRRPDTFHPFVMTLVGIIWVVFTLLPVLVALSFAEQFGSQSVRYFVIWGLIAAAGVWFVFVIVPLFDHPRSIEMVLRDAGAFAAAGLAFGFVYWLLAGRTSGDWMFERRS